MGKRGKRSIIAGVLVIVGLFGVKYGLSHYRKTQSMLDEEIVYAHYQKQINAMRTFDAETQCKMMHPQFRLEEEARTPSGKEWVVRDRREACKALRESMATMKAVVKTLDVEPNMMLTIESVDLSQDRRHATVKLRYSLEIGKRISLAATGTEMLMRHKGDVYTFTSRSKSVLRQR